MISMATMLVALMRTIVKSRQFAPSLLLSMMRARASAVFLQSWTVSS